MKIYAKDFQTFTEQRQGIQIPEISGNTKETHRNADNTTKDKGRLR